MCCFSGKDCGNLPHIMQFIRVHKLELQVKILGFVPPEDIRGLYENAIAVVMPTYFGPTSLPPLEAWSLGVPLIYSTQLAEHAGSAALLVDPDNETELTNAMLLCTKSEIREKLVSAGYERLAEITEQREVAEIKLCMMLQAFANRRLCWQ